MTTNPHPTPEERVEAALKEWRNCRDIGLAIHFWPLTWRFGFRRTADLYGGEWSISVGPICLTLSANIGNCSSENRFEAWLGLSEAEAAECAERAIRARGQV